MVMAWWYVIVVTPRSIVWPWKKGAIGRLTPGFQITFASPIMPTRRLIDTTSFVASVVPTKPRMITRSSRSPNAGASTPRTTNRATGAGHPQSKRSCQ